MNGECERFNEAQRHHKTQFNRHLHQRMRRQSIFISVQSFLSYSCLSGFKFLRVKCNQLHLANQIVSCN